MTGDLLNKTQHIGDLLIDHWTEIKERRGRGKDLSLKCWPELDNLIWGLKRRTMVVVAGRPSMGKSTVLLEMAYCLAAQGKKVTFFTLEMTHQDCLERIIANQCSIKNTWLTVGGQQTYTGKWEDFSPDVEVKVQNFYHEIDNMPLVFIESWGKTFDELHQAITQLPCPDVVIVDYVNMVKGLGKSKKEMIDEYITALRTLAIEKDFCVIIAAQINRSVHKNTKGENVARVPEMWELKESGGLEEIADLCFITHWAYWYNREDQTIKNDYIIKVAKNRNGRTGTYDCSFFPEYCRVKEKMLCRIE